jgi:hypothetical protein
MLIGQIMTLYLERGFITGFLIGLGEGALFVSQQYLLSKSFSDTFSMTMA